MTSLHLSEEYNVKPLASFELDIDVQEKDLSVLIEQTNPNSKPEKIRSDIRLIVKQLTAAVDLNADSLKKILLRFQKVFMRERERVYELNRKHGR